MVDDLKSLKDTFFKTVFTVVTGDGGDENSKTSGVKEMISALAGLAGKGKDEIVQIISREIGLAVAAAFKEPLAKALEDRKIRVTIEFVPDKEAQESKRPSKKTKKD